MWSLKGCAAVVPLMNLPLLSGCNGKHQSHHCALDHGRKCTTKISIIQVSTHHQLRVLSHRSTVCLPSRFKNPLARKHCFISWLVKQYPCLSALQIIHLVFTSRSTFRLSANSKASSTVGLSTCAPARVMNEFLAGIVLWFYGYRSGYSQLISSMSPGTVLPSCC